MRISDWSSDVCSSDLTACRDRRLARVTGGPEQTLGGSRTPSAARTARRLHPGADGSRRLGLHRAIAKMPAMSDQRGLCGTPGRHHRAVSRGKTEARAPTPQRRSEEHTSELQSIMRISYAVFCLKKKNHRNT